MRFRRSPQPEPVTHADWAELVRFQQMNTLAIAHLTLKIAYEPQLATEEVKGELVELVRELEDRLACFEEYVV